VDLDLEELAAVIELLDKADFTDFRYEKGDLRIAVRRGGPPLDGPSAPPAPDAPRQAATTLNAAASNAPAPTTAPISPGGGAGADHAVEEGLVLIRSSMLGAFYRSPKPGDPPFVEVGDKVDTDSVVGIVEVMKLMNSVAAGVAGEIVAVHAENGDLVEFEQPLFSVRPIP
jgi:acetyl-CoA carboxylase biotin carboxyl carrier protein